ncbi:CLUMA_CG009138, isoform A [Clunio marinus]|uniref:Uricase n=1 Tax=Clunio marinus TaxID=568069 RepID=A0A1J1I5Y2_9DIPT|nr:CLUMA_CG009138, isoform A [Clunio marinus]
MAQAFEIRDRFYGKNFIKIAQVERNGANHVIKEYEMELKMSLAGVKEYTSGMKVLFLESYRLKQFFIKADNSELICANGCIDTIYILANNHGIKSPEAFGTLVCNHLLSEYDNMTMAQLTIEDFAWNKISYDGDMNCEEKTILHNHAFIHNSDCARTCTVTFHRKDDVPTVTSGIKNLRLMKTAQAQFIGFRRDGYTTLPDIFDKLLCTNVTCTWNLKKGSTYEDYNRIWNDVKNRIIKCWGGDPVEGVLSTCMQFTLQTIERNILESNPEIISIQMLMPNLLYADFDFSKFKTLEIKRGFRSIHIPSEKPLGAVYGELGRLETKQ